MNFSFARLRTYTSGLLSSLANKRWLLLALFVQGMGATGYLYLERNWIETGVVQSLKNVSSMHLRSFEQLENTLRYQLLTVGERMLANSLARKKITARLKPRSVIRGWIRLSFLIRQAKFWHLTPLCHSPQSCQPAC